MVSRWRRSSLRAVCLALGCLLLPACETGGHFTFLGYSTRPNYDTTIRTVRVPIFKNETHWRGLEFELTEAVIREIEFRTPYRVVPASQPADTELVGTIVAGNKTLVNVNQLGGVREAQTTMAAQIVWRDLRGGFVVDQTGAPIPASVPPGAPPADPEKVMVQSIAEFRPELGESITTARERMVRRLADRIVSMMEQPW